MGWSYDNGAQPISEWASMSYKIILGDQDYSEPNKDEVIAFLISEWNARSGLAITVIWPDSSRIDYEGFE